MAGRSPLEAGILHITDPDKIFTKPRLEKIIREPLLEKDSKRRSQPESVLTPPEVVGLDQVVLMEAAGRATGVSVLKTAIPDKGAQVWVQTFGTSDKQMQYGVAINTLRRLVANVDEARVKMAQAKPAAPKMR